MQRKDLVLLSINLNTTLQRSKLLLNTTTGRTSRCAEDQLGAKRPSLRNVPGLSDVLADGGMEVLEIAAETFGGKGGPGDELVHAVGVFVPFIPKISISKLKVWKRVGGGNLQSGYLLIRP